MRSFAHKARVVGLLLGFYLLCVGLLALMLVIDVLLSMGADHHPGLAKALILAFLVTIAALLIVVRGIFVSTRMRKPPGIAVTPEQEPLLWERVRELSKIVGTRPPREIRLVPQVNAAVWEDTKLLGLIPGKRHMMIGLPLMLGLTRAQLDAIIAHELGHFSGAHTRSSGLDARVRASVVSAARAAAGRGRKSGRPRTFRLPGSDLFAELFTAYARLVVAVTNEQSRKHEYAADRVAAQIAGRAAVASALRELPALDSAYDFYLDQYVSSGLGANLLPLPVEILGGFAAMLQDPARRHEMDEIRHRPPNVEPSRFDSHPPLPERIAAVEALSEDGKPIGEPSDRAIGLLVNPAAALCGVGLKMVQEHSAGKSGVDWNTLASAAGGRRAVATAEPLRQAVARLSGTAPTLLALLALIDGGRMPDILKVLPRSEAARKINATGRALRELAKTELSRGLHAWLAAELAASGRLTWTHTWSDMNGRRVIDPELEAEVDAAIESTIAVAPEFEPLGALVRRIGASHELV